MFHEFQRYISYYLMNHKFYHRLIEIYLNYRTTDVGVAVFSDILNRRVKTLKLQISNPEPENAVKVPPMNPGKKKLFYHKYE